MEFIIQELSAIRKNYFTSTQYMYLALCPFIFTYYVYSTIQMNLSEDMKPLLLPRWNQDTIVHG